MRKLDKEPQTLGQKLRALRRGQAVSMEMMERSTHIQRRYLDALERGRYGALPEPLYTRNFIRAYARVLGADEQYFLELYEEECGRCDLVEPMRAPRQRARMSRFFVWNRFVASGLISIVILGVFSYLGWQVYSIMAPPEVVVLSPVDAAVTDEAIMHVEGLVQGEASVYVNGEQVALGDDNVFEVNVDLEKGLNTITVEAERRYSRRAILERQVFFDPDSQVSLLR